MKRRILHMLCPTGGMTVNCLQGADSCIHILAGWGSVYRTQEAGLTLPCCILHAASA
jgi:hypothetical protein